MTTPPDQVATLQRELEDAFQNRAHLYRLMLDELESAYGHDEAVALMSRALERRGREVAAALFKDTPAEPEAVGRRFLSVSPDGGRMYPHEASVSADAMDIRVHRCPLKDAWRASDLPSERVATLCSLAGAFDKGLFEAAGLQFSNQTWSEERGGGCCWIRLERAESHTP
ncbi:L-2-amino-thiazoline-4-carboxylic acid hydrolase [Microvirga antarctica]|uniref:L-2-amino-thiazoline-4-carboxylic acid hydrolase n=1 Tax=Microvirga antarctica TaxID=2819233 RepID=UPI001B317FAC|nr:L-2-amino-thiazoline-4-carboxylic acid hydrolase [Microvirga antarctica]